jgi:hypothetical protein
MDRAETIVRERAKKRGWTEEQIQTRIAARRWARRIGMRLLLRLADAGINKAEDAIQKKFETRHLT